MATTNCQVCEGDRVCDGFHVYVIELSDNVASHGPFAKLRPDPAVGGQYYYVGSTAHTPACRLEQHRRFAAEKAGFWCGCWAEGEAEWRTFVGRGEDGGNGRTRGNRWAGEFGVRLVWRRFRRFNPLGDREAAEDKEEELALTMRAAGHAVHFGV